MIVAGEVIKHGDLRCIMNEGMPQYRNPFEKGRLIIAFSVKFPQKQWLGSDAAKKLTTLEALLPARIEALVPDGAEECLLTEIDPDTLGGAGGRHHRHGEAYEEDEDGPGGMHGQRVQCAQH